MKGERGDEGATGPCVGKDSASGQPVSRAGYVWSVAEAKVQGPLSTIGAIHVCRTPFALL